MAKFGDSKPLKITNIGQFQESKSWFIESDFDIGTILSSFHEVKPYLFPMSSITDEDYATYCKIWEDTGKKLYLDGCHYLIINIKAYRAASDYLLSKHYDINGLIPMGLAIDATNKNIY